MNSSLMVMGRQKTLHFLSGAGDGVYAREHEGFRDAGGCGRCEIAEHLKSETLRNGGNRSELCNVVTYSSRSRIRGLTESARCAGIHVASNPSAAIARITPASTSGSRGVA